MDNTIHKESEHWYSKLLLIVEKENKEIQTKKVKRKKDTIRKCYIPGTHNKEYP